MAQAIVDDEVELGAAGFAGGPATMFCGRASAEWLFLVPALLFFIGYQVWPIVRVLWLSFTNFQFLSDKPAQWVWFDNYAQALHDPLMWTSLWRAAAVHDHVPARNDHPSPASRDPRRPSRESSVSPRFIA